MSIISERACKEPDRYEQIIDTISRRFVTYGYKRIRTSAFQPYDLYSNVNSSINQNEMIKIIDYTGEVLVLRPDVTIPITMEIAQNGGRLVEEARYYYVQEVFRQPFEQNGKIAGTQAGIEYFSEKSPETDAEVIALACHIMKDLGFNTIKIEIGHAGFFNEVIRNLPLTPVQTSELKTMIQAKNAVEINDFLSRLAIDKQICELISDIPFLYGNPIEVFSKVDASLLTGEMQQTLDYIKQVFDILKMYGLEHHLALDLGLINHMDYYSGVIFQGYISQFGKPVLMGGRYDQLGNEFGAYIPAIGFAYEIESLVNASESKTIPTVYPDVKIIYEKTAMQEAILLANELRNSAYSVLSFSKQHAQAELYRSVSIIRLTTGSYTLQRGGDFVSFATKEELVAFLRQRKENKL